MKIKDSQRKSNGKQLSHFNPGDCVRLVSTDTPAERMFVGDLYVIGAERDKACNLGEGTYRFDGLFVLVNATVVVE